jgi:hypothetical protein
VNRRIATVALYASDMPTRIRSADLEQIAAWVKQGVERLVGEAEAERLAELDLRSAGAAMDRGVHPDDDPARRALWPSPRRHQAAVDCAYFLQWAGGPTGEGSRYGRPVAALSGCAR